MPGKSNNGNGKTIWLDSLWMTRKESLSISTGEDEITREFSIGGTVRSDERLSSSVLYDALNKALASLIQKEKDVWLKSEIMRREATEAHKEVSELDDFLNGNYEIIEPGNGNGSVDESSLDDIPF